MTKNTAKKRAAGGVARRLSGPLGSPVASPPPASPSSEGEVEVVQPDAHSSWCLICHDGAEGDVVLYKCSACPWVMCSRCLDVPSDSRSLVAQLDILFWCLSCHTGRTHKVPAPYYGFYRGSLPAQGGEPALQGYLQLNGRFETASSAALAAAPIAVIHFILGGSNEVVTPVPLLSHYLEHYFPNGGYIYIEDARITQLKSHLAHSGRVLAFFSDHSEEDSGWLFAGREKGKFVAMSISQPLFGILGGAIMMFLVCGSVVAHGDTFSELQEALLNYGVASSIIFSAKHFQPLVATHFLLSLAEQVIIEDLDIRTAFPGLLSPSPVALDNTRTYARAHMQTQPWGIPVPSQCPLCGSTNSWSERVTVKVSYEPLDPDAPAEAPVSSNTKAIRRYYLQFLTDEDDLRLEEKLLGDELEDEISTLSPEEREAAARPKDAAFYKKAVTDWDVAQKLFKQEIDEYDKEEQAKLGVKNEIKYRTGHTRDWFKNMTPAQQKEVENAREKWNRDSAPLESQTMYRKRHLKRILDDFAEQMCCTMGCWVMILASHKKSADQTLNVIVHELKPVNSKKPFTQSSRGNKEWISEGFKKFTEWSKLEFYLDENDDQSTDDEEDDGKVSPPEVILDKKGYPKLPSRAGVSTRGQQELVCQIFRASYKVFTNTNKPVPWHKVVAKPSLYLDLNSIPEGFILRDPSHMRAKNINELWAHWQARKEENKKLVIFVAGKIGDMSKELLRDTVPHQEKMKKMYVEIEPGKPSHVTTWMVSVGDAQTERVSSTVEDVLGLAQVKGANESAAAASTGRTTATASRPSGAQEGAPATVPMKDRIPFLKSLSSNNEYLLLVEGIRDLGKKPNFNQQKEWPAWATWSWEESYLLNDVHCVDGEVQKFLETAASIKISGLSSAMECKRAIEYEADEVTFQTPSYISTSILDIKVLDMVVESVNKESSILDNTAGGGGLGAKDDAHDHKDSVKGVVEAEMRQKLADELQMLQKNIARNEKLLLENQEEEDERRLAEEQRVEEVEQDEEGKEGKDVEVEVEVKGKKRAKSSGSRKPSKKVKVDIRRSSRSRQPTKKAMKL
ncbi:uncharacterized protein EDB93DRAFT_1253740 [Suillus bovinus]|uniref:uncharacterized protein n=1 Tax=Suillus bovinus TaxID=48563 RepID=UPI001B8789D5|nr:uncharacterized protein EDB93DRAFT_1253740 [Suillus bovinus]KAG2137130.1 hypothetical protein EDB93DRAFT_1253740 [Suillus bovinus]